ncbi:MAG TPA: hypothetical protein VG944_22980 [Fimbriimonas sp.]|nr:hypothetical protein [Fimbriimonas sp.]
MSKTFGSRELSDTLQDLLSGIARFLLILGGVVTLLCVALLIFLCFRVAGDSSANADALKITGIAGHVLLFSSVAVAVGGGFLWWGEDVASAILVLISAALYFAPLYVPSMLGDSSTTNSAISEALGGVQTGGMVLGSLSIISLLVQVGIKVRQRAKIGVKADHLKYGKGVKEEADRQNVFMGSCWQLPYCRRFVRERCPIFHSKRTCWRERVGCMCEEEVIRNAMENKPIPKDALLATNMIPKNFKLTEGQKAERCRNCVIYNEHQRHKYKLSLPVMLLAFAAIYFFLHGPLVDALTGVVLNINKAVHVATISGTSSKADTPTVFVEILLFICMLVVLTYALKVLEFLLFKLKV